MKRKKLMGTVLAGALTLTGCAVSPYEYQGIINEEFVKFESTSLLGLLRANRLLVRKPDGRTIIYLDSYGNDLKLDYILIKNTSDEPAIYESITHEGEIDKKVIELAQTIFDYYLKLIDEAKKKEDYEKQMKEVKRVEEILKILKQ
ncbi:hypothetical protein HYX19_05215 [Candidatus Woesearchaeota archaeon]|nr:hypothetical protein [Candidatus Woesearchaeota archaeon]